MIDSISYLNQAFIVRPGLSPAWKTFWEYTIIMCVVEGLSPSLTRGGQDPCGWGAMIAETTLPSIETEP